MQKAVPYNLNTSRAHFAQLAHKNHQLHTISEHWNKCLFEFLQTTQIGIILAISLYVGDPVVLPEHKENEPCF